MDAIFNFINFLFLLFLFMYIYNLDIIFTNDINDLNKKISSLKRKVNKLEKK